MLKDTTIYDSLLSYRRTGIWKETDTLGMIWKGNYKNGLREGEWKEGILLCCNEMSESINDALHDSFRPYITHYFKNGIKMSKYRDSTFWPKIKGKWYLDVSLSNVIMIFHRSGKRMIYNFKSATQISYPERSSECSDCFYEFVTTWKQKADLIEIGENKKNFEILKLTDDELIIQFVKWRE